MRDYFFEILKGNMLKMYDKVAEGIYKILRIHPLFFDQNF